jgi:hypothetical protein
MADKPNVNLSIAALEAEIGIVEPYVIAMHDSKRVTFPDVGAMPAEEAEDFLDDIEDAGRNSEVLEKWLSAEDYETFREAKLSLRTQTHVLRKVGAYYESTLGDKGKGRASRR